MFAPMMCVTSTKFVNVCTNDVCYVHQICQCFFPCAQAQETELAVFVHLLVHRICTCFLRTKHDRVQVTKVLWKSCGGPERLVAAFGTDHIYITNVNTINKYIYIYIFVYICIYQCIS